MERRFVKQGVNDVSVESRDDGPATITGLAAVYYDGTPETEFRLWDDLVERIMPGAFDRALAESDDVRALFNHDSNAILGRVSADTLALKSEDRGLRYDIEQGDTTTAKDVAESIRRGDVTGSSFGFRVTDQDFRMEDEIEIREIRGVELFDVGPVTYPAYAATTAGTRSVDGLDEARSAHAAWKAESAKRTVSAGQAAVRARAVEIQQGS